MDYYCCVARDEFTLHWSSLLTAAWGGWESDAAGFILWQSSGVWLAGTTSSAAAAAAAAAQKGFRAVSCVEIS